jgi:hypothetical protein
MNLAPCPDCRNSCSLLAQTCPKCGRPFQAGELESAATTSTKSESQIAPETSHQPALNPKIDSAGSTGCLIVLAIFIIVALLCMSGRRSETSFESPDSTPVGTGAGSGRSTATDVQNNPCYRACAMRMTAHPDELAPRCRNVTPVSEYQECIQGAAASIADLCLKECGLK